PDADGGSGRRLGQCDPHCLAGGERTEQDSREQSRDGETQAHLALPGPEPDRLDDRRTVEGCGRHLLHHPFAMPVSSVPACAGRSRKMAATRADAATNTTIRACNTETSSSEMPAATCVWLPPARSAPKSSAASNTPHGLARPSRPTSRPSKPALPTTAPVRANAVPSR